ncbi:MAG TPA: hypothetical protein VKD24_08085 [Candidatus Angelobacter sp.]|nr:hypothetical protein [Candidatus Angelobacter sp.]
MPFFEDDLKNALRPKDPGPGFTQRVMAKVSQAETPKVRAGGRAPDQFPRRWFIRLRPAMIAAAATVVLAAASWVGYEKHLEAKIDQARQEEEARQAEQKAILALRIANAKLNHVLKRVSAPAVPEPKIRRQSL